MKRLISCTLIFVLIYSVSSFTYPSKSRVNWISFKELAELYKQDPKPVIIDVYTNWCGWCKEMDRKTYRHTALVNYINQHYYAIRFNAESQERILFNGKTYQYDPNNKSNELAQQLLFGSMQFPTTVFLPSIDSKPAPLAGFMTATDMEAPLKYFGDGSYRSQTFVSFNEKFKGEWR